jgi:hypothetical protein
MSDALKGRNGREALSYAQVCMACSLDATWLGNQVEGRRKCRVVVVEKAVVIRSRAG